MAGFAGGALASALFMIETAAMLLLKAFNVLVLGHSDWEVDVKVCEGCSSPSRSGGQFGEILAILLL